jgi:hypothetical protein
MALALPPLFPLSFLFFFFPPLFFLFFAHFGLRPGDPALQSFSAGICIIRSKYGTKGKRVQFLGALSPAWTELVVCDASTATPVVAAVAAEPTWPGASGGSAHPPPGCPHPRSLTTWQ